ncbi:hypothetical protein N9045_00850 [bacterium]|nr:hypothetical protein [bacterium]
MTLVSTTPSAYTKEGFGAYTTWESSSNLRLVSGAANSGTGDINLRAYIMGTGQVALLWDSHATSINPATGQPYNSLIVELLIQDNSVPNSNFLNIPLGATTPQNRTIDSTSISYITEVSDTASSFFASRGIIDPLGGFNKPFTAYLVLYEGENGQIALPNSGIWSANVFDFTLTNDIDLGYVDATTSSKSAFSYVGSTLDTSAGAPSPQGIYAAKSFANYALNVPQGAQIVSAKLKMTAAGSSGTPIIAPQKIVTYAENADNSPSPTSTTREQFGDYLDSLAKTSEVENEKAGWGAGTPVFFDCTAAVQDVVNRVGWVANNNITIFTEMRPTIGTNITPFPRGSDDEIDTLEDLNIYLGFTGYFQSDPELEIEYGIGGVGSSSGVSTVNGNITNGIAARATGLSSASAFAAPGVNIVGSASGSSTASAIGGAGIDATASGSGSSTSAGVGGEGREANSSASSSANATSESGASADGSASGSSATSASSQLGQSAAGQALGTSIAAAISSISFITEGNSQGSSTVAGLSNQLISQPGTAVGTSTANGLGESQARATGSASSAASGNAVGGSGLSTEGNADGLSNGNAIGESLVSSAGISSGFAVAVGQGASENRQSGSATGQSIVYGVGASEARAIFESIASSIAEARYPTRQETFFKDLSTRVNVQGVKHLASRLIELDGGKIIEPTAFEPDAATYRDTHYYNAKTNILYIKVITRQEPGVVVAHWQKVSQ